MKAMIKFMQIISKFVKGDKFQGLHKSALPLSTGFLGTVAVFLIQLPMPALLGPMLVNGFLCLNGLKMNISRLFFPPIFITIGIYIGSKMEADIFSKIISWFPSIIFLLFWMTLATVASAYYFQRYAKFDKLSAVYSALPGAFASIMAQAEYMNLDHRKIIMSQSVRIFLVVGLLPLFLVLYINEPLYTGLDDINFNLENSWLSWIFCIALIICASGILAKLKVPSPYLLGSIAGSGFFFATGQLSGPLPNIPLMIALYLLGSIIGTRFSGCRWRELFSLGMHGLVVSLLLILFAGIGAFITSWVLGMDVLALLLAYGPGGINEISIIAYTFDINPTLVVFLHFIRILVITLMLPFIPRIIGVPFPYANPANISNDLINRPAASHPVSSNSDSRQDAPNFSEEYSRPSSSIASNTGSVNNVNDVNETPRVNPSIPPKVIPVVQPSKVAPVAPPEDYEKQE